jgi:hypothetical protein
VRVLCSSSCFSHKAKCPLAGFFLSLSMYFTFCTGDIFFSGITIRLYYSCSYSCRFFCFLFLFFPFPFSTASYPKRGATRLSVRLDILFVVHWFFSFSLFFPDLGLRVCQCAVCASPVPSKLPRYPCACLCIYRTFIQPLTTFRLACRRTSGYSHRSRYVSAHASTHHEPRTTTGGHGVIYGMTDGLPFYSRASLAGECRASLPSLVRVSYIPSGLPGGLPSDTPAAAQTKATIFF